MEFIFFYFDIFLAVISKDRVEGAKPDPNPNPK